MIVDDGGEGEEGVGGQNGEVSQPSSRLVS